MKNIYLISVYFEDTKLYKIGYTRRKVEKRIKELKTANPYDFDIVKIFEADKYGSSIERNLHQHFRSKKIDGEWFSLSEEDVNEFESLCQNYYKNFEIVQNNNTYLEDRNIIFK